MKSQLERLEDELKRVWRTYNKQGPIKGAHTEIEIEPRIFIGDELNSQIAEVLASVYLSKTTIEDVEEGNIEIMEEAIVLKDKETKKPVATVNK